MRRLILTVFLWAGVALPVQSAGTAEIKELTLAIGLPQIIDVMRQEGTGYGEDMAEEMFPSRAGSEWNNIVADIYDPDWMERMVWVKMSEDLKNTNVAPLTSYFQGQTGRKIIDLEVSARLALMDDAVEGASKEHYANLKKADDPRLKLIEDYIQANDLIENNIVGTLNSNLAFYKGLVDSGGFERDVPEQDMLRDVWADEPNIRADTEEWLYSFLVMAYQPLSDAELKSYITLSQTPEGQALNLALFSAFDGMFEEISRSLGVSAAGFMSGEDL